MGAASIRQMAERIATLMEERMGIRGATLAEKLAKGGKRLPVAIREDAAFLADAAEQAENPALFVRLDHARVAGAYDRCLRHLKRTGRWERRGEGLMRLGARLAWVLLVGVSLALGLAWWRGLL